MIRYLSFQVLDLHHNKFTELPDAVTNFSGLQVLNVENNDIKKLPKAIGNLQALQTLNARGKSNVAAKRDRLRNALSRT